MNHLYIYNFLYVFFIYLFTSSRLKCETKRTELKKSLEEEEEEEAKVHEHLVVEMLQKQDQGFKQVLESENNKLSFEQQTLLQDKMKKAEMQLQELQVKYAESERQRIELAEKMQVCQPHRTTLNLYPQNPRICFQIHHSHHFTQSNV